MEPGNMLVLVRGAGDSATGVGRRLFLAGFRVVMTELPEPLCIRRTVAFAEAVYNGSARVEEVESRLARFEQLAAWPFESSVPVIIDPEGRSIETLRPDVLIDARLLKRNDGTRLDRAPIVGALGPGYIAGKDCHFVVETERGHALGRVLYSGSALPDSGKPGAVMGHTGERVVYASRDGLFHALVEIGETVSAGTPLGKIEEMLIISKISGVVRGILRSGLKIQEKTKLADVDPRGRAEFCSTVSDRSNAIAGGVLEGILSLYRRLQAHAPAP